MQSYIKFLAILLSIFLLTCQVIVAEGISSQVLIEQGKSYDNKPVTYEGEVIGDIMKRGDHAWINVHDGNNALGIWINNSDANKIKYAGTYKYTGDIVRIQGIFHRACSEHGGDIDIHASKVEIVERGAIRSYQISRYKILLGTILPVFALLFYIVYRKSNKINVR